MAEGGIDVFWKILVVIALILSIASFVYLISSYKNSDVKFSRFSPEGCFCKVSPSENGEQFYVFREDCIGGEVSGMNYIVSCDGE